MFKKSKKFKKTHSIILSLVLLLSIFILPSQSFATNAINVTINGTPVSFNDTTGYPFIDSNNRTLVPLRVTMEAYGCGITWNQATQTASVSKDGYYTVEVNMNSPYISIGGNSVPIDTSAQIVNGRVYLPIRPVLEAFGANVNFNNTTYTIEITKGSGGYVTTPTTNTTTNNANNIPCYAAYPNIPDFGALSKATLMYTYDGSYLYSILFDGDCLYDYSDLLIKKGFTYKGSIDNKFGNGVMYYENKSIGKVVSYGIYLVDDEPYFTVIIFDN